MRRVTKALVACAGAALLLAGCGGTATTDASTPAGQPAAENPARKLAWQPAGEVVDDGLSGPITLHIGGGFAGVDHGIEVTPEGTVVVSDRGDSRPAVPLSAEELARLEAGVAAVDFEALPARSINENAADMFIYRLEYAGHSLLTDLSKELGPVEEVIGQLSDHLRARERA